MNAPIASGDTVLKHQARAVRSELSFDAKCALERIPYGVTVWNKHLRLAFANSHYLELYGIPPKSTILGGHMVEILAQMLVCEQSDRDHLIQAFERDISTSSKLEVERTLIDGRVISEIYTALPEGGWLGFHDDASEKGMNDSRLKKGEKSLQLQNEQLTWAIDNMTQGLCLFAADETLIISNRPYAELYRIPPEQVRPGQTLAEIVAQRLAAGNIPIGGGEAFSRARLDRSIIADRRSDLVEFEDGRVFRLVHQNLPGGGWVATHEDVTDQRRSEEQIRYLAQHDVLTGLPNRAFFRDRMAAVEAGIAVGESYAIHFLDLDGFKAVNDTLGHATGDAVLTEAAERIRRCVGPSEFIARLGGDEFAVLQGPLADSVQASELARRFVEVLRKPIEFEGQTINLGTSVGIAIAPTDGVAGTVLMRHADAALYRGKALGRGAYHFFDAALDAALQEDRALEADVRRALDLGQFTLAFQPLINLKHNRISCFEALLRWLHPIRGPIPPAQFIPIAEHTGQITAIGEWVIREACRTASAWPDHVSIAVNLSPRQFTEGHLLETVVSALAWSGLAADRLELEITESVSLGNTHEVMTTLTSLRELGVKIAMDDFGTGYSSLSYLRMFPFDKLKIDRSFVTDLATNPENLAIVKATAALGKSLGMDTTAEGVETAGELELIQQQGYTEMQGFLLSPAVSANDAARMLARSLRGDRLTVRARHT